MRTILSWLLALAIIVPVITHFYPSIPMTYNFELNGLDEDNYWRYQIMMDVMEFADSNDTIVIDIKSPGGYVVQLIEIANAMHATKAKTVTVNKVAAYSAAAIVSLLADEIRNDRYTEYLFHRPRYYDAWTGEVILAEEGESTVAMFEELMRERIYKYLTLEEQQRYWDGEDVIILGSEMQRRVESLK